METTKDERQPPDTYYGWVLRPLPTGDYERVAVRLSARLVEKHHVSKPVINSRHVHEAQIGAEMVAHDFSSGKPWR